MAEFRMLLPDGQGILGSVDDSGELTFVVLAGTGSPIRGTEMFDLMMRAFGDRVHTILGIWRRGFHDHPSVNLDKVNELTVAGFPLEDAIEHTWTVKRAKQWGFTRVRVISGPIGRAGDYVKMDVLMEKVGDTT
jgi:hypothetical protein